MTEKSRQKAKVIAITLAVMAPLALCIAHASAASPGSTGLIDKDFEVAVRKFISKRFYNRIDATDEQRSKLDSIWMSTMDTTRPQREALRQGALELSTLMASDEATDEQITAKVHELRALHEKVNDQRVESLLKARKVLTKEQRGKINNRLTEIITGGLKPRRLGMMIDRAPALLDQ